MINENKNNNRKGPKRNRKIFPEIENIISDYKQYKVLRSILSYNVKRTNQTTVENYAFKCR